MEEEDFGYITKQFNFPTKRYYQSLDLKKDEKLIELYKKRHQKGLYWEEVGKGIRDVGILGMDIYLSGERLLMVVETSLDFNWDQAFKQLAEVPIQKEWEKYMSVFQEAEESASSAEKWERMERIFTLADFF